MTKKARLKEFQDNKMSLSRGRLIVTHNLHGWEMDVLNEAVQQARLR